MRPRTLVALFVASSVVTIGLNAAGAFDRGRQKDMIKRAVGVNVVMDESDHAGHSRELAMLLSRRSAGEDEFTWAGVPTGAQEVEVRSLLGSITVKPAKDDSVRVIALRHGDGKDAVLVKVLDRGSRLTICAAHPRSERSDATVGCGTAVPSASGRKQMRGDARVNFAVELPSGMRLVARAVDGRVEAMGLTGDIEVTTVNGDVAIETTGAAEAKTMNGNIEAKVGRLAERDNRFETLHGNVTLMLPATTSAAVRAESVTGNIETDLPIQPTEMRRMRLVGTLGGGGPELLVKTVAGNVALRKSP